MKPFFFFFFYVCLSELQIKEQKDNGLVVGPWRGRKGLKTVLFPSCTTFSSGNKLWFPRSTAIHQGLMITHSWASLCLGPQVPIQWIWGLWATQKVLVGPTEGKRQGQWECSVPSDWWKKKILPKVIQQEPSAPGLRWKEGCQRQGGMSLPLFSSRRQKHLQLQPFLY